jgi:proteic killer suppression protein
MIISIKHKGLKMLWEEGRGTKLPPELVNRIEIILVTIDSAQRVPEDFEAFKNWSLHTLSGNLNGYWSVKVNKNFRVIFRFDGRNASDLDFVDYH